MAESVGGGEYHFDMVFPANPPQVLSYTCHIMYVDGVLLLKPHFRFCSSSNDMVGVAVVAQDHVEVFSLLLDVVSGGYGLGSMEQA